MWRLGQRFLRQGLHRGDLVQELAADTPLGDLRIQSAGAGQGLGSSRQLGCEIIELLIADDATARDIAPLRLPFAPGSEGLKRRQIAPVARAALQAQPGIFRREIIGVRVGERRHLLPSQLARPLRFRRVRSFR